MRLGICLPTTAAPLSVRTPIVIDGVHRPAVDVGLIRTIDLIAERLRPPVAD